MLKTEQCTRVATELWGWIYTGQFGGQHWEDPETGEHFCGMSIPDEVNSWQGFGRTVERIRFKNIVIADFAKIYTDYMRFVICDEQLWEATHLVALEALK